jgi:Arc/MetJ-type ribon-helix-helix transcriptional regulator
VTTRRIDLPEAVVVAAEAHVAAGRFATVEDVLRAALAALDREQHSDDAALAGLRAAIDDGDASGVFPADPFAFARAKHGLGPAR